MSCERYQRLLHLNRSGEISSQEAEELRQHLRVCERCALEFQRIERADRFIDRLSGFSPTPGSPEQLTADILRRVRGETTSPRPTNPLDRMLEFFLIPTVRYSAVAIVLLITLTFGTQVVMMLDDISKLEQHMASPIRKEGTEATYSLESGTLTQVTKSEAGKPLQRGLSLTLTNGRIDVSAKDVEPFLSSASLRNLPAILGTGALRLDKNTLDKIINEIKATAELTFRVRHEGA